MQSSDIGIIGLSVMGANIARNIASHGYHVSVFNRTPEKTREFMSTSETTVFSGYETLTDFVGSLKTPSVIFMMVKAGAAVDDLVQQLLPIVQKGTVLIDGGNSHHTDTARRVALVESTGSFFVGMGVSGGEYGALHGPSLMPGGSDMAWPIIEPLFRAIAAPSPDGNGQCVSWIGKGGSGHFVKMVHNGIEYADMQLIAESYGYMRSHLGMTPDECAVVFEQWNTTELSSYLIGITADICRKADDRGVGPLLDRVSDRVSQKGTGIWTSQMSLELGIPVPTITEAVNARFMSANATHSNHKVVSPATTYSAHEKQEKLEKLRVSLYLSKIVSYSQGFALISKANEVYGWDIHPSDLSRIWQAGCIIRARVLTIITESLITYPDTTHLFESPLFVEALRSGIPVWRTLIAETITSGMPLPGMTSALLYVDSLKASYRSSHLIALQRDYFGSHGYERTDMSGVFHTDWS